MSARCLGLILSAAIASGSPLHCLAETIGKPSNASFFLDQAEPQLRAASHCRTHATLLSAAPQAPRVSGRSWRAPAAARFDPFLPLGAPPARALSPPPGTLDHPVVSSPAAWAAPLLI
ncbi:MAG: hypothetical protein HYV14_01270 [Elusimicrobia bacterium]|nr:hypothetical protein [Elusimicrobiota bacterium]